MLKLIGLIGVFALAGCALCQSGDYVCAQQAQARAQIFSASLNNYSQQQAARSAALLQQSQQIMAQPSGKQTITCQYEPVTQITRCK